MFNLIHNESIIKVDFIVKKKSAYHLNEFLRKRRIDAGGFQTCVVSKEDLILAKLLWARDSLSETQLRDVKNLLSTGADLDYVASWVKELDLQEVWRKVPNE